MKKFVHAALVAALVLLPSPGHSAYLQSPDRIEMTILTSNTVAAVPLVDAVMIGDPPGSDFAVFLLFDVGAGAFPSFGGAATNLTNASAFTYTFNGQSAAPTSGTYLKDTENNLIVALVFSRASFSLCTGLDGTLSLDASSGAPRVPLSDSFNADILSFSGLTIINSIAGFGACSSNSGSPGSSANATPTPAKYSGPEFSGLSSMGVMTGSSPKLEGKRLNEISSIEIGGKAATFTETSATELSLSLPAGLAPGLYDLVINSSAGKLTHINAIQVRAPKQSFSIMTRSKGKISEQQYLEHSLIASMQIPELNKARCVVNASSVAMARAMADRLCAIVKASNPNIETTVVEPRSSVKGDAVFARVSYGWN